MPIARKARCISRKSRHPSPSMSKFLKILAKLTVRCRFIDSFHNSGSNFHPPSSFSMIKARTAGGQLASNSCNDTTPSPLVSNVLNMASSISSLSPERFLRPSARKARLSMPSEMVPRPSVSNILKTLARLVVLWRSCDAFHFSSSNFQPASSLASSLARRASGRFASNSCTDSTPSLFVSISLNVNSSSCACEPIRLGRPIARSARLNSLSLRNPSLSVSNCMKISPSGQRESPLLSAPASSYAAFTTSACLAAKNLERTSRGSGVCSFTTCCSACCMCACRSCVDR